MPRKHRKRLTGTLAAAFDLLGFDVFYGKLSEERGVDGKRLQGYYTENRFHHCGHHFTGINDGWNLERRLMAGDRPEYTVRG